MKGGKVKRRIFISLLLFTAGLLSIPLLGVLGVDNALAFSEQECRECHGDDNGSTVNMHHLISETQCTDCHGSVYDPDAGYFVYRAERDCTVCHGDNHHTGPSARQGLCDNCHIDPRDPSQQPNGYLTKQFGCDICHIQIEPVDQANSTLTVMAYDPIQPTGRPDGITKREVSAANGFSSDHVFTMDPGATINNYGVCFYCHGPTGYEKGYSNTQVLPFHGHYAVNWPADNFTDPLDDRPGIPPGMEIPDGYNAPFGSNAQWAPGRGIFNAFETARRWPDHFYNNNNSNPEDNVSRGNQYNGDTDGFFGPPAIEFSFYPVNYDDDPSQQYWVPSFDVVRGVTAPSDYVEITRVNHDANDSGGGQDGNGPWAIFEVEGNCSPSSNLTVVVYGGKTYSVGSCSSSGTFEATIDLPVDDGYTNTTVWRNYFEEGAVWVVSEGQGYDWHYGGIESRWDGCWADGNRWDTSTLTYTFDPDTCRVTYVPPDGGDGGGGGGNGQLTDTVTITMAEYSSRDDRLTVYATSSSSRPDRIRMDVMYDGRDYPMSWDDNDNRFEIRISARSCNDSTIEVVSSEGGTASISVQSCSSHNHD